MRELLLVGFLSLLRSQLATFPLSKAGGTHIAVVVDSVARTGDSRTACIGIRHHELLVFQTLELHQGKHTGKKNRSCMHLLVQPISELM
jgi:hypothetical protein